MLFTIKWQSSCCKLKDCALPIIAPIIKTVLFFSFPQSAVQQMSNDVSVCSTLLVSFPGKPPSPPRLACRKFLGECCQDKLLKEEGGREVPKRADSRQLGCEQAALPAEEGVSPSVPKLHGRHHGLLSVGWASPVRLKCLCLPTECFWKQYNSTWRTIMEKSSLKKTLKLIFKKYISSNLWAKKLFVSMKKED